MVSEGKGVDWGDVVRMEEEKMVDVTLRLRGGGKKKKKRNTIPWNSKSETEKSETEKSRSEESSVEEAWTV